MEADDCAVVINDICLSVPGTGNHLLMPVALKEAKDNTVGVAGAILRRDLLMRLDEINLKEPCTCLWVTKPTGKEKNHTFLIESPMCQAPKGVSKEPPHIMLTTTLSCRQHYSPFDTEETSAYRNKVTHPRSLFWEVVESGLQPTPILPDLKILCLF